MTCSVSWLFFSKDLNFWHCTFSVLPNGLKQRLANELGKRLDLDIEKILDSPKLELQLSPAELDKRLLELYENVAGGPGGDLLRVIGGGNDVAFQTLYIKRNAAKERKKNATNPRSAAFGPFDVNNKDAGTPSQSFQRTLKRNLKKSISRPSPNNDDQSKSAHQENEDKPKLKMRLGLDAGRCSTQASSVPSIMRNHFCPPRRPSSSKFTLLI